MEVILQRALSPLANNEPWIERRPIFYSWLVQSNQLQAPAIQLGTAFIILPSRAILGWVWPHLPHHQGLFLSRVGGTHCGSGQEHKGMFPPSAGYTGSERCHDTARLPQSQRVRIHGLP